MQPRRPYLIRALYDWLIDSGELPHLLVDADAEGVRVPREYVQEGRIILNIGPDAVGALSLGNEEISFQARFGGRPMTVSLPPAAVVAIYGRDSGQGMMFGPEDISGNEDAPHADDANSGDKPQRPGGKPTLKIIK